jgi:hypothetical protein
VVSELCIFNPQIEAKAAGSVATLRRFLLFRTKPLRTSRLLITSNIFLFTLLHSENATLVPLFARRKTLNTCDGTVEITLSVVVGCSCSCRCIIV